MGSIVGAVSVIALVIFNARYLYLTRKMSESAAMQAATAQATLAKLENQIAANLEIERHAALTVLNQTRNHVAVSTPNFRSQTRLASDKLRLMPDDWNVLAAYVSRHLPDTSTHVTVASLLLHTCEDAFNRLTLIPTPDRSNRNHQVEFDELGIHLDNLRKAINEINSAFYPEVVHTPPD